MNPADDRMASMLLQREIEEFYYAEADMLDERRLAEWVELFTDDVRYWMPLVRNVQFRRGSGEYSREGTENAWIDEDKRTLTQRVQQIATGIHWAEEPRSRMSHLIRERAHRRGHARYGGCRAAEDEVPLPGLPQPDGRRDRDPRRQAP